MKLSALRVIAPVSLVLLALGALASPPARAESAVKMYSSVPSEAELALDLFPTQASALPGTRSVVTKGAEAAVPTPVPTPAPEPKRVGFKIQFQLDSAELEPESLQFVDQLGALLAKPDFAGQKLMIEGHTDASGPDDYNYLLSKRRARAVAAALTARFQIEPGRLIVSARGEDAPLPRLAPEDASNRRVEFEALQ